MNAESTKIDERVNLAGALARLTRDLVFSWGETCVRGNSEVAVSINRAETGDGEPGYLITVMAGFPPDDSVRGLPWTVRDAASGAIRLVGQTDARGQFSLSGLPSAEYLLRIEGLVTSAAVATMSPDFAVSLGSGTTPSQVFSSDDEAIEAKLRVNAADRLVLEVVVRPPAWSIESTALARFRISDDQRHLLAQGFLGLLDDGGLGCGEMDLDALDHGIRSRSAGCHVEVAVIPLDGLTPDDRQPLEESLRASEHPTSRAMLEQVLARLDES